jgi:hypothetical protein
MSLRSRLNHLVQRTVYWLQVFRELGDENHPKIRQLRNALQYVPGPIASTNAIRRAIAELLLALGDLEDETESESDDSEDDNSNPEHFIETEVDDMNLGSGMKGGAPCFPEQTVQGQASYSWTTDRDYIEYLFQAIIPVAFNIYGNLTPERQQILNGLIGFIPEDGIRQFGRNNPTSTLLNILNEVVRNFYRELSLADNDLEVELNPFIARGGAIHYSSPLFRVFTNSRRGGMINENNGNDRTQINDLIDEINHCDFLVRQAVIDGEERAVRYYKNQVERRVRDLLILAFNGRNSTYTLPEAIVNLISEYL